MPDLPSATLLAFDFGQRRIGVAVGQTVTHSARPLTTLVSSDNGPDWEAIEQLIDDWGPNVLLVGLPLSADGSESDQCRAARQFAADLGEYEIPVQLIDEHLTSAEATDLLREARRRGNRQQRVRKGDIDALSAALIAEQWLNQRNLGHPSV